MRAALERVKRVVTTSNLQPHLAFVHLRDGWLSGSDGKLYASAPCPCDLNFLVSGKELDRALAFHTDMVITQADDHVLLKHGRSRIKLKCADPAQFHLVEEPSTRWKALPLDYFDSLRRVRAFCSENATQAWALGVMEMENCLVATNNITLAVLNYPGIEIKGIVPFWLIDYVTKLGEDPIEFYDTATAIYLRFEDGSWLRSTRVEGAAPEQLIPMVRRIQEKSAIDWEIPPEWRDVYKRTLEFSERDITVSPTGISARGPVSEIMTEIETPVPFVTYWDHRYLGPVLKEATHWEISECGEENKPGPTYWSGRNIRGVIMRKLHVQV